MTGFTPGPWTIEEANAAGVIYIMADGDMIVAEIDDAEADEDANLIAAAPELYEALEGLFEFVDRHVNYVDADPLLDAGRDALAKARGEQTKSTRDGGVPNKPSPCE